MKIAFTADVHLTSQKKHPDRYNALEFILNELVELKGKNKGLNTEYRYIKTNSMS